MENCQSLKDFYALRTIKREPVGSSNSFDETRENLNSQKYHCKRELDLNWDERDNNYDVHYETVVNEPVEKSTENKVNRKEFISISQKTRTVKTEKSDDTEINERHESIDVQKYHYKEELILDWDERDSNNYDVQLAEENKAQQIEKNESILQNKIYLPKKRKRIKIENPDTEKDCPRCKKRLKNLNTLTKHMFYCGKEPHLRCDSCSYKAKYKNALITHITRNHSRQIQISRINRAAQMKGKKNKKIRKEQQLSDKCFRHCENCNVSTDKSTLNKCRNCQSQLLYQCRKCKNIFQSREKLTRHTIDICDPKGHYHCPACQFKHTIRQEVKFHMTVHLIPGSRVDIEDIKWKKAEGKKAAADDFQCFTCPSCKKQFQRKASLGSHMRFCIKSQGVIKPSTPYMGKKDSIRSKLRCMITKHCSKCQKIDAIPEMKIETSACCGSNIVFKCSKCSRPYERIESLYRHLMQVCTPQTKCKCDMCDYEGNKINLIRHLSVKHDCVSVKCPRCKTKLKNKNTLRLHLVYCGKGRFLKCEHCSYTTNRRDCLNGHRLKKHAK